jgi:CHASE3 domain sensor protein
VIRRWRRLAVVGLGVTLVLLAAVDWVTILAFRWTLESGDLARNTLKVLAQIETAMGSITDLETGQRGFVLTGQAAYLEPYEDGLKTLPGEMARLRQLTKDNPPQQQRLDRLDGLVKTKLDELKETIEVRRTRGLDAAVATIGSNTGKHTMDQIRAIVADLEREEHSLLGARLEALRLRFSACCGRWPNACAPSAPRARASSASRSRSTASATPSSRPTPRAP